MPLPSQMLFTHASRRSVRSTACSSLAQMGTNTISRVLVRCVFLLFSLVAISVPFLGSSTAFAATTPRAACCAGGYYYVAHLNYTGNMEMSETYIEVGPGRSVGITKSFGVANSWSANVGIKEGDVSAGVGFSVTYTNTESLNCSYNNTTNQNQFLTWWGVYANYNYDVYWHYNNGANKYVGSGWAQEYIYDHCN